EGRLQAMTGKAHAIDDAAILGKPEQARPRIAVLRPGRDAADLDQAKAQPEQGIRHLGILVEAGGEADRIGERPAPDLDRERWRIGFTVAWDEAAFQAADSKAVRRLGIEARQQQ